ncbi:zinc ribbon domain-containing protein, partial [Actinacidiphila glaucinigra]
MTAGHKRCLVSRTRSRPRFKQLQRDQSRRLQHDLARNPRRSRPGGDQGRFICRNCGVVAHADRNASHNIAARGAVV